MTNALIIGQASLKSWEKNTTRSYFEKLSQSIFPRPSLYFCDNTQLQTMAQGNFTFGEKAAAGSTLLPQGGLNAASDQGAACPLAQLFIPESFDPPPPPCPPVRRPPEVLKSASWC